MHAPLPANTASPAFGSPGSLSSTGAPPAAAAPAVLGMSSSVTSTVPPRDSRNAAIAQSSERLSPIGGLSIRGMMFGYPSTRQAPGSSNDSLMYCLAPRPGLRL